MSGALPTTPPDSIHTHSSQHPNNSEKPPIANWLAQQHSMRQLAAAAIGNPNSSGRARKVKDVRLLLLFIAVVGSCLLQARTSSTWSREVQTSTEKNFTYTIFIGDSQQSSLVQDGGEEERQHLQVVEVSKPSPAEEENEDSIQTLPTETPQPTRTNRIFPISTGPHYSTRRHRGRRRKPPSIQIPRTVPPLPRNAPTTPVCLTDDCIQATALSLARAFPDRSHNKSAWCNPSHSFWNGLSLVRVPKSASSTTAGVALRIAHRHRCGRVSTDHHPGRLFRRRDLHQSFLFTSVRDPGQRWISFVQFRHVSIGKKSNLSEAEWLDRIIHPTDNNKNGYGDIEQGQGGFTLQFTALDSIPHYSAWHPEAPELVQDPTRVLDRVETILNGYDFVVVVERMDESLVALALILGIDLGDVLVTDSKAASSSGAASYFYEHDTRRCHELIPTNDNTTTTATRRIPPAVYEYFQQSNRWRAQNYGDYLLHAAANRSLDATIQQLGMERFQQALQQFRALQEQERRICAPKAQFPCSRTGQPQLHLSSRDCYYRDFGCGYKCIDEMLWTLEQPEKGVSNPVNASDLYS